MRDAQHHGSDINREHRILLPDGTTRWVDVRGRCQFSPEGTPIACNGVTIDITERCLATPAGSQRPGASGTVFSLFLPYDAAVR